MAVRKYVYEIPKDAPVAAAALKWLAERIGHYTLIYKHHSLNAYAWGGLANAPDGIWRADKVVFDDLDDAGRYEQLLTNRTAAMPNA